MCSLTSRRRHERRDVGFITLCHVVTSSRTSRRCPVLSPRTVHFWLFTSRTPLIGTLAFLRTILHRTCRRSHPTGRRSLHCVPTTSVHHGVTLSNWFLAIVAFPPHCTRLWHWLGVLGSLCIHSWSKDLFGPSLGYF